MKVKVTHDVHFLVVYTTWHTHLTLVAEFFGDLNPTSVSRIFRNAKLGKEEGSISNGFLDLIGFELNDAKKIRLFDIAMTILSSRCLRCCRMWVLC